jgi:hypothetical protein
MLLDQLGYLSWMTGSADQDLGTDAFARYETLRGRLDALQTRWEEVQQEMELSEGALSE